MKFTCYICKGDGATVSCDFNQCKNRFHVSCAERKDGLIEDEFSMILKSSDKPYLDLQKKLQ